MIAKEVAFYINIGSSNGLVLWGTKPLPGPMFACSVIPYMWRLKQPMSELIVVWKILMKF